MGHPMRRGLAHVATSGRIAGVGVRRDDEHRQCDHQRRNAERTRTSTEHSFMKISSIQVAYSGRASARRKAAFGDAGLHRPSRCYVMDGNVRDRAAMTVLPGCCAGIRIAFIDSVIATVHKVLPISGIPAPLPPGHARRHHLHRRWHTGPLTFKLHAKYQN